jgi:hypothetical protein
MERPSSDMPTCRTFTIWPRSITGTVRTRTG